MVQGRLKPELLNGLGLNNIDKLQHQPGLSGQIPTEGSQFYCGLQKGERKRRRPLG